MSRKKDRFPDQRGPEDSSSYSVGYGKPPEKTRFKKGDSGNPKGRPKGAKNKPNDASEPHFRKLVLAESARTIEVREGDSTKTCTVEQAVIRTLAVNALRGQPRALKQFLDLLQKVRTEERQEQLDKFQVLCELKYAGEREIARCRLLGKPDPEFDLHPDDIHIDPRAGTAEIRGPITPKEKKYLEFIEGRETAFLEEVEALEADIANESDEESIALLKSELRSARSSLAIFQETIRAFRGEPDPFDQLLEAQEGAEKLMAEYQRDIAKNADTESEAT